MRCMHMCTLFTAKRITLIKFKLCVEIQAKMWKKRREETKAQMFGTPESKVLSIENVVQMKSYRNPTIRWQCSPLLCGRIQVHSFARAFIIHLGQRFYHANDFKFYT